MNEKIKRKEWSKSQIQFLIALISVLIPVLVTVGMKIFEKEKKEISIYFSELENILATKTALDENINLYFDSLQVKNISVFKLYIINSGNEYISKDDFIDGAMEFIVIRKHDNQKQENIPCIFDVVKVNDAKQRNSVLKYFEKDNNGIIEYLPSLLNPDDIVQLDIFIPNATTVELNLNGKIRDGDIIEPSPYSNLTKQNNARILVEAINNILGSKWISLPIFILFFASMALGTIGFLAAVSDDKGKTDLSNLTFGAKLVSLLMFLQTIMFLVLLILITIY